MNLLSVKDIKGLLQKYDAAPLKRMGQNFLINRGVLEKIIEAADLDKKDIVLEIGPGLGTLTQELAKRAKKVIAIEKDRKFAQILKETLKQYKNVKIIQGDVLEFPISNFQFPIKFQISNFKFPKKYKLIANLPYNIASAVIRRFLETENTPQEMIVMVQKEVAQRICACPPSLRSGASRRASPVRSSAKRSEGGQTARMSLLAVSVQFYSEPKIISHVSRGSFWPSPKVDSAILKIVPFSDPDARIHPNDPNAFFKIVKAGFSSPRKQLAGNLSKRLKIERHIIERVLKQAGIDPSRRAETLSMEEWIKIVKYLIPNI